jgi:hypothetical protein
MKRAEKLHEQWSKYCPPEVSVDEFDIVIRYFLGEWLEVRTGTSHRYHVTHEALTWVSYNSGYRCLTVPVTGGRKVKAVYVRKVLNAIRDIYEAEGRPLPGGE